MSGIARRLLVLAGVVAALALASPGTAVAHPLGRFTVNHYNGLTLHSDRLDVHAVVDSAEIPTFQARSQVDTDGNDLISPAEGRAYATGQCDQLSRAVFATVDGEPLRFTVRSAEVSYPPGEAGLPTTRLVCELSAPMKLDDPAVVTFVDSFRPDRIGWREITAVGQGVSITKSSVPSQSISQQLRNYPEDLLEDPLNQRSVELAAEPDSSALGTSERGITGGSIGTGTVLDGLGDRFSRFVGTVELTPIIGVLAVLLSLVLGASHAAMPGHGKTVIAAYLAGRQGTMRDAVLVGGTVTMTHTAGVLVVGLLLSAFSTLAGETVLAWLGLVSGLLLVTIGAMLLRSALRTPRVFSPDGSGERSFVLPSLVVAGHDHGHGHAHGHGHGHGHVLVPSEAARLGRPSLFGMGVAAGLVPSPTALLVLLATIGFGRTWFGVLLVLGYGVGMAGTLTAVGLLLVGFRDRMERKLRQMEASRTVSRLISATPLLTSALVLVVGVGIVGRALVQLI